MWISCARPEMSLHKLEEKPQFMDFMSGVTTAMEAWEPELFSFYAGHTKAQAPWRTSNLKHMHDAMHKAELEDAETMKRFQGQKDKADKLIMDKDKKQLWNVLDANNLTICTNVHKTFLHWLFAISKFPFFVAWRLKDILRPVSFFSHVFCIKNISFAAVGQKK